MDSCSLEFRQAGEHSRGNNFNHCRNPLGFHALCRALSHLRAQCRSQNLKKSADRFVNSPQSFDFSDRMQYRRVMPTVVEPTDLGRAPAPDVLRQVHRDLTAKAGSLFIPWNASGTEMI